MMGTKVLAVIPARGGSKRLPRKNITELNGKPLIGYTIEASKQSNLITASILSTDDLEIQNVAKSLGANSPFLRPSHLATDTVRNSETMIHALEYMEQVNGVRYDAVLLLQPTSPFRTASHIDDAINTFLRSDADSLASIKGPYKKRDINLKRIVDKKMTNLIPENEEYYIYNSAIYIIKRETLLLNKSFTSENETFLIMDERSSIDIDTPFDLKIAECLAKEGL
jgi:CMP-N,N'-diacetyllegionaminic acid synthase